MRTRHWPEAVIGLLGTLSMVVIWLHVYSHTPAWHSEPTWSHTIALVAAALVATIAAGWLLRARLCLPWWLLVALAEIGPVLVVASGVIRSRSEQWHSVTPPVVGALGAAVGYTLGAILLAAVPIRARVVAVVTPLALAFAIGHVAYGLPAEQRYDIARSIGFPWPNEAASELLYGHVLES